VLGKKSSPHRRATLERRTGHPPPTADLASYSSISPSNPRFNLRIRVDGGEAKRVRFHPDEKGTTTL
jgi:hypothetical protein